MLNRGLVSMSGGEILNISLDQHEIGNDQYIFHHVNIIHGVLDEFISSHSRIIPSYF